MSKSLPTITLTDAQARELIERKEVWLSRNVKPGKSNPFPKVGEIVGCKTSFYRLPEYEGTYNDQIWDEFTLVTRWTDREVTHCKRDDLHDWRKRSSSIMPSWAIRLHAKVRLRMDGALYWRVLLRLEEVEC